MKLSRKDAEENNVEGHNAVLIFAIMSKLITLAKISSLVGVFDFCISNMSNYNVYFMFQ